ncbi:hypothetical protein [Dinoroseobacter sp. S375]|uniref:hypothetical protein n=1 Tax=Dinoroseobacter sp. S375 TaxID=3415136 RepID=UPI003C7CA413
MNAPLDHFVMEISGIPKRDLAGMPVAFQKAFGPEAPFASDLPELVRENEVPLPYRGHRSINPRSRGSCRIFAVLPDLPTKRPRIYGLDSQVEYHNLVITLTDPNVEQVHEQVGPIPFKDENGFPANHFIDLLVTKKDGFRIAVAVKPTGRMESGRFMRELIQLRETMPREMADELRLVTERSFSRTDAFNAEMYLRFSLTHDPTVDDRLVHFLETKPDKMTICEICQKLGAGGRTFRCVVRAIYQGSLRKLSPGRINLFTEVVAT